MLVDAESLEPHPVLGFYTLGKRRVAASALGAVEAAIAALAGKDVERTQAALEKPRALLSKAE